MRYSRFLLWVQQAAARLAGQTAGNAKGMT
jgi:hypothetical protein